MALYAFDGTWNEEKDAGEYGRNTNVVRFRNVYEGRQEFYTKGVGTRYGLIGKVLGGAFGVGGRHRIREASAQMAKNFVTGDTDIDIIGFSRGAALALHFANVIAREGVRDPATGAVIAKKPTIRFLGLWDLVAAFGIPINLGIRFNRINLGYVLTLPDNVQHCFHALALDECRQAFRPTRTKGGYEVWFRGVHSDVGGGNDNAKLNNIALRWMLKKAVIVGLPVPADSIETVTQNADPNASIGHNFDAIKNASRTVKTGDRIHYTVSARQGCVNPPDACPVESRADEGTRA